MEHTNPLETLLKYIEESFEKEFNDENIVPDQELDVNDQEVVNVFQHSESGVNSDEKSTTSEEVDDDVFVEEFDNLGNFSENVEIENLGDLLSVVVIVDNDGNNKELDTSDNLADDDIFQENYDYINYVFEVGEFQNINDLLLAEVIDEEMANMLKQDE